MKKTVFILLVSILITSCNNSTIDDIGSQAIEDYTNSTRLHFDNEDVLRAIIENDSSNVGLRSSFQKPSNFISLMDKTANIRSSSDESSTTYYEELGYDTLVPNPNFAALLNIKGELGVGEKIIKIKPEGTYIFDKSFANEIDNFIASISVDKINSSKDEYIALSDKVSIIKTFDEDESSYTLESEGNNTEVSDDYFDLSDDQETRTISVRATSEPDYSSFQTFSADRTGFFSKLIQSIIGSTKASTINYNNKRRLRGSFYFYNYGVYSEIGVKGWTDKKNWIGWSKTPSDELRVSWRNIIIKKTLPNSYQQTWDDLRKQNSLNPYNSNNIQYFPPQKVTINNKNVNAITIVVTDQYANSLKDKIIAQGAKVAFKLLENELKRPSSEVEQAEAAIVASRTNVYVVYNSEEVKKYNCKNYTHVFSSTWMDFEIGWSNTKGFNINGIGSGNVTNPNTYLQTLGKALKEKKPELVGGEVSVCARLGDVWKGMKIVKNEK